MEIKVLGSGCSRCKKALEVVNKVVSESGIDANVEYVTDIMRVMEYNGMGTPAVVVDGEVKIKGSVPTEADVRKALGLRYSKWPTGLLMGCWDSMLHRVSAQPSTSSSTTR